MAKKPVGPDTFGQLKMEIREKKLGRLYFFYGEETFLLNYYLEKLHGILLDSLTESFNYHRFSSETFSVEDFGQAVDNLPMMAPSSLVQVDDVDIFKCNESDRTHLAEILSDIPDYCTVVFTYLSVQWKPDKRLKKLWEPVEKGLAVEFAKQNERDLVAWITRHFASGNKRISSELCTYLIDLTGGTMTALSGEIQKLCAYSEAPEIKKSDIDAVVEPVLDAVVFQMTDMLGEGRYADALGKLHQLLKMQQEPIAILGAIGVQFRRLACAKTLLDCGKNAYDLQRMCGMADYPARKTMEAARRLRSEFCAAAVGMVMETDYQMKTSYDDQERLIELLLLKLSMEARRD